MYKLLCSVIWSCLTLCESMDCSPPGFSVCRIFQARILKWVAVSFFRGFSQPRNPACGPCPISCIAGEFFTVEPLRKQHESYSHLVMFNSLGSPGFSVHGILQARILEWVSIPFSRSCPTRDWTQVSYLAGRFFTFWATREALGFPAMKETQVRSWLGKIPWRRELQPIPVFLPEEFHGLRSLRGYSLWGRKESDPTERLTDTHIKSK